MVTWKLLGSSWLDSAQSRALLAIVLLLGMGYIARLSDFVMARPEEPLSLLLVHDVEAGHVPQDSRFENKGCHSVSPTSCPAMEVPEHDMRLFTQVCMKGLGSEPATDRHNNAFGGSFACACCGAHVFDFSAKCDANTRWPSFHTSTSSVCTTPQGPDTATTTVTCKQCGAHIGQYFPDKGKAPLGSCMNQAGQPSHYSTNGVCLLYRPP